MMFNNKKKRKCDKESKESIFSIIMDIFLNIVVGLIKLFKNIMS
ncbi:Uncharacterised protein [Staphylococcus saprophyticus]|uniref:Uncharacterized protein n=1 Tax=Staphylococcus saprophyticus TaxID=29385 RepID=A0A380HR75_STASA|nr:Uncharacterised protein [Staphylococcus saprophyticus]